VLLFLTTFWDRTLTEKGAIPYGIFSLFLKNKNQKPEQKFNHFMIVENVSK